jgi:hypothetical protein
MSEGTQFLTIAVRFAAMPGLPPTTPVFRAVEGDPDIAVLATLCA